VFPPIHRLGALFLKIKEALSAGSGGW